MLIFKQIKALQKYLQSPDNKLKTQGFVPTMGALHQGHLSLIKRSKKECNLTICSIFVNPTQFNDKTDFEQYPNTIATDIEMLNDAGCDVLFLPSVKEMYPDGFTNAKEIKFGFIAETLEGEHRPGHFAGMAQVVEKLLRIVKPDKLYMGQKDFQQQLIVQHLIKKRKLRTELVTVATMREKDGLAMSSRNVRLDADARKLAVEISKTLKKVKSEIRNQKSELTSIAEAGRKRLMGFKEIELEYFEIRNAQTLKKADENSKFKVQNSKLSLVALVAVKIGGVRLIDNMLLN
jgi:pantoate--beta-alanine ligase